MAPPDPMAWEEFERANPVTPPEPVKKKPRHKAKKCSYSSEYRAIRPPKCNGGVPCDVCKRKWVEQNKLAECVRVIKELRDSFKVTDDYRGIILTKFLKRIGEDK